MSSPRAWVRIQRVRQRSTAVFCLLAGAVYTINDLADVESDRVQSSRFPGFLRGFDRGSDLPPNNWDTSPDVWPELRSDLQRNPPALIVDTAAADWSDFANYPMSNYPVLAQLVAADYRQVATVDGVVIYARVS